MPRESRSGRRRGWREVLGALLLVVGLEARAGETWAIEQARLIPSATGAVVEDGTVVVRDGKVKALGPRSSVRVPEGARRVDGSGGTVLPGFWNVHVHFTDERFTDAAHRPAEELSRGCREMLTSRGFTTVVDLGSWPENTVALRRRAPSMDCPRILMTGIAMYPAGGVPIYVRKALGDSVADGLPQPKTGAEAARFVQQSVKLGARATKLFVGTWLGGTKTGLMDLAVVKGATAEAHRHGLVVFAHPGTNAGIEAAIEGGVNVLAHTAPEGGPWSPELIQKLRARRMALAPTLSLWRVEAERGGAPKEAADRFIAAGADQLRVFAAAGGEVLFGTDVGYIPEKDADEEAGRMSRAGMDWRAILVSLTSAPARRMRDSTRGALAVGAPADLVLVEGDPRNNVESFTHVRATWVAGKSVFSK